MSSRVELAGWSQNIECKSTTPETRIKMLTTQKNRDVAIKATKHKPTNYSPTNHFSQKKPFRTLKKTRSDRGSNPGHRVLHYLQAI